MRKSTVTLVLALSCGVSSISFAQQPNPPANICLELTAYLDQSQKVGAQQAATAPQTATASGQPGAPGPAATATAVEQASRAGATAPAGQDEAQRTSGMSGPVPKGGPGAAGPQGNAQEASNSGSANPKPDGDKPLAQASQKPPEPKTPSPDPKAIDKGRQAAAGNDLDGCSAAVRDMRMAGVPLPAPLIALAALKPELRAMAPQGPAPGVPPIPPSGVKPPEDRAAAPQAAPAAPTTR